MTHSNPWQDTQPFDSRGEGEGGGAIAQGSDGAGQQNAPDNDFSNTEVLARDDPDPRWWSEAADGQCSAEAAQFAASQPAPLSIV